MNNRTKLNRVITTALLATAFAASGLTTIGTAMKADVASPVWLTSAQTSAACGLMAFSGATAMLALAGLGLLAGGYAFSHLNGIRSIPTFFAAWQGETVDPNQLTVGTETLLICAALAMAMLFFLLLYRQGFSGMAIMLLSSMLVFSHGMSHNASIAAAIPGLIAGATAFALGDGPQRDAVPWKALLPSALAVALALMLTPMNRATWTPMEDLANRVRYVFEQYFNFTHERIAFSIGEEGYNHGGEVDGQPVAMLGGPANPDNKPAMRVTADGDLLLRGTIRSYYTGYSWIDIAPKTRYLYYDLTHRAVRDRVFNQNVNNREGFEKITGKVELLDSSTSTLFVPGRLNRFDMELSNAVYFNSSGEMFMAREARPGDQYAVVSLNPVYSEALRQATLAAERNNDAQYNSILSSHTQLPDGVEPRLMALTAELTADADNAYDKAMAIMGHLRRNMRYRLDVEYPPHGRDFASYFVLDAKQGYCSYFATAMAVMGRLAGLPTRYVEGYSAHPGEAGVVTLTGMNAHAWAEVYFKGLGWIAFDATNGGAGNAQDGANSENGEEKYGYDPGENDAEETPFEDTSDTLDGETEDENSGASDEDEEDDGQESEDENDDSSDEDDSAAPEDSETPPNTPDGQNRSVPWFLIVILIIVLIALAIWWMARRLESADPMALCRRCRRAQQAALIAYRANLTLLSHIGQQPQSGETPDAFAQRIGREYKNPDFAEFVRALLRSRYGGRPMKKESVEIGLRAYRRFLNGLSPIERLRFAITRIMRGLGDFENIP